VDAMCGEGFLNIDHYTTKMGGPSTQKGTPHYRVEHELPIRQEMAEDV
jgi:hypothetical protein